MALVPEGSGEWIGLECCCPVLTPPTFPDQEIRTRYANLQRLQTDRPPREPGQADPNEGLRSGTRLGTIHGVILAVRADDRLRRIARP